MIQRQEGKYEEYYAQLLSRTNQPSPAQHLIHPVSLKFQFKEGRTLGGFGRNLKRIREALGDKKLHSISQKQQPYTTGYRLRDLQSSNSNQPIIRGKTHREERPQIMRLVAQCPRQNMEKLRHYLKTVRRGNETYLNINSNVVCQKIKDKVGKAKTQERELSSMTETQLQSFANKVKNQSVRVDKYSPEQQIRRIKQDIYTKKNENRSLQNNVKKKMTLREKLFDRNYEFLMNQQSFAGQRQLIDLSEGCPIRIVGQNQRCRTIPRELTSNQESQYRISSASKLNLIKNMAHQRNNNKSPILVQRAIKMTNHENRSQNKRNKDYILGRLYHKYSKSYNQSQIKKGQRDESNSKSTPSPNRLFLHRISRPSRNRTDHFQKSEQNNLEDIRGEIAIQSEKAKVSFSPSKLKKKKIVISNKNMSIFKENPSGVPAQLPEPLSCQDCIQH